jgi:methanogenic corrinoid protein MtbC1
MVSGLLRQRGVRMHFLGANVATSFLVESVMMREPDAVVLSITLEDNRPSLVSSIRALRTSMPPQVQPIVVVGGPGDGVLIEEDLGDVRALQAKSMGAAVEEIMGLPSRS